MPRGHMDGRADLKPFAFDPLAFQLASPAHGLGLLAGALFRGLLVIAPELHFAEYTLALQFLLERLQGLINIVVTNQNLHVASPILFNK